MKEVVLRIGGSNFVRELAERFGVNVTVADCKPLGPHRMAFFLEVSGSNVEGFLERLKQEPSVKKLYYELGGGLWAWAIVVADTPAYCGVVQKNGVFCLSCPMSYVGEAKPLKWRILVGSRLDLRRTIELLGKSGVEVELDGLRHSNVRLTSHGSLSPHQREVLKIAYELGYFDFPRRITLRRLAQRLGVKPSTLSETMRRAQSKVVHRLFEQEI